MKSVSWVNLWPYIYEHIYPHFSLIAFLGIEFQFQYHFPSELQKHCSLERKSAFPLKSGILWSLPSVLLVSSTICWSLGIFSYLWIKHRHVWQKTGQLWCRWAKIGASEQGRLEEETRVELRRKDPGKFFFPKPGPQVLMFKLSQSQSCFVFLEIIWTM